MEAGLAWKPGEVSVGEEALQLLEIATCFFVVMPAAWLLYLLSYPDF
jgi:hypothetical protein